jgi:hypothetical protein
MWVFYAAMVVQQRGKIDIAYAISLFSDILKRIKHDRYLKILQDTGYS